MENPVLELKGITKEFPGVVALDKVSFDIRAGEVHALVGENGAGKSTLMKILAGLYQPNEGQIVVNGEAKDFRGPLDARQNGILLIHQELALSPELSVAENIFLGAWPSNGIGVLKKRALREKTQAALDALGCDFSPSDRVGTLSVAKQQMVEIARALAFDAKIVVFDEPTASLTDGETEQLFATIRSLREQGVGMVYISHKMDEIFEITDRITILRDGVVQGTLDTKDTNDREITKKMIGRDLSSYFVKAKENFGEEILRVEGLTCDKVFKDISFSLRQGEVLGFYGLVGAGRSEVVEAIFGTHKLDQGKIWWKGETRSALKPKEAINLGIGLVPESRKEQGLVLGMGGRENMTLPHLEMVSHLSIVSRAKEMEIYNKYHKAMDIRSTGSEQKVGQLSGGNQQKIVLSKWLCAEPRLIILDEPTRGIDVGSKSAIHELIAELAENHLAVIVISSEMPEVLGVSHRVIAMSEGQIVNEFTGDDMTEENLINAVSHHLEAEHA